MNRPRDSIYPPRSPTVLESKEIISAILPLSESCLRTNMAESKPIVILHVITTLGRGGAERQLVNLVSNTNRAKFEHIVCCLQPPTDLAPEIETVFVPAHPELSEVSSSNLKELARQGADLTRYCAPLVAEMLRARLPAEPPQEVKRG